MRTARCAWIPSPGIYVYEQTYEVPGSRNRRSQIGFFARLRLEDFGPGSGVLPHERTMSAPKEDRYLLMRATGVNTSPIIGLFDDPGGESVRAMNAVAAAPADIDVTDDDGVRHRLWHVPENGPQAAAVATLIAAAGARPIAIADGHHRYETALRYRDEERAAARHAARAGRTPEADPATDYVLMLFLEAASQKLTVLPTHRIVRGLGEPGCPATFWSALPSYSRSGRWPAAAELEAAFASVDRGSRRRGQVRPVDAPGRGHSEGRSSTLSPNSTARPAARPSVAWTSRCCRSRWSGCAASTRRPSRPGVWPTPSPWRRRWTSSTQSRDGADMAFLLDPTPVAEIAAVAARRRRHAAEVDLLLPKGPDRAHHQPPRVVSQTATDPGRAEDT